MALIIDRHAQLYIAVTIHRLQQQLVVQYNPLIVHLLFNANASYPHANGTYLSTIIRAAPLV